MMTNRISLLINFAFMLLACVGYHAHAQNRLASWKFQKQASMTVHEQISGEAFKIVSNFDKPEYVAGISGDGLRLDGYSTFVTGTLSSPAQSAFSITGWFALETYPADTAGFFSIADHAGNTSISAAIDQAGSVLIGMRENSKTRYASMSGRVEKFKWLHIGLTVNGSMAELYVNGKKAGETVIKKRDEKLSEIYLGRDYREKMIYDYFPVTAINGLIDEVDVWNGRLSSKEMLRLYKTFVDAVQPVLAIPRIRFADDFNRPLYHLLPGANWTNETHGLIYHKGQYHIFNQKNGTNVFLGQINWGHFSSPDLIHWTEHKPALEPDAGYDRKGIWSGHAVVDSSGNVVIMYTGSNGTRTGMNLAFAKDDALIEWQKYQHNPVVDGPPVGFERVDMRDPYLWKDGSTWYMIVGYGVKESGVEKGALLLYKSSDLKKWAFVHTMFEGNPDADNSGIFWEMPVIWKMGETYVLLVNKVPQPGKPAVAMYWTGKIVSEKFVPDHSVPKKLELINRLLSPSVTLDEKGRTVAIAIIPDEITAEAQLKQGWTHLYSIPRVWTLRDGILCQSPLPELAQLRYDHQHFRASLLGDGKYLPVIDGSHQIEVAFKLKPVDAKRFGFIVAKNNTGTEQTRIYFDLQLQKVVVDATKSTQRKHIPVDVREAPWSLNPGDELEVRMFVDGSVIEVFINNETAFTTRIFPNDQTSTGIELFSEGGNIEITGGDVWKLKSPEITLDY